MSIGFFLGLSSFENRTNSGKARLWKRLLGLQVTTPQDQVAPETN
jgi:hypothetical protein